MKRFCLITWGLAILLMALSSCLGAQQSAAESIHSDNAAQLQAVSQTDLQPVYDLAWSPDGSSILAVSDQGATRLKAATLKVIDTFTFEKPVLFFDASQDGKTVAFSSDSMNLFLTDISAPQNVLTIQPGTIFSGADFSPDGLSLVISSEEEIAVQLWDATTGKEIGTYTGFETAAPVYAAQYGEDGLHIIWISRGTVQLMDTSNGKLGPVFDHEDFVMDAALTPDGDLLASAAAGTVEDNFTPAIFLWNTASGEQLSILVYPETFSRLAFCPDGSLIAAASGSRLTIWDAGNSQLLAELDGHTDRITSLAFSPDGSTIATASADGSLVLWQVPDNR